MEKNENEEKNPNFSYQYTEILYLIFEGYKNGVITIEEKSKIKELVILNHPSVFILLKNYHFDGVVNNLWGKMKDLVFEGKYEKSSILNSKENFILNSPDLCDKICHISSPFDCELIRKKKIKTKTKMEKHILSEESNKDNDYLNYSTNLSDISNSGQKNPKNDLLIKSCMQGNSPTILLKHYNSYNDI